MVKVTKGMTNGRVPPRLALSNARYEGSYVGRASYLDNNNLSASKIKRDEVWTATSSFLLRTESESVLRGEENLAINSKVCCDGLLMVV